MSKAVSLFVFLLIAFVPAAIGGLYAPGDWYQTLEKPDWNPPNWIFGPVWTVLYVMIGISGWLIWERRNSAPTTVAFTAYFIQLALNAVWSWLFFGLHLPGLALVEILFLWVAILVTVLAFWRISPIAGALLVPYLLWVTFASALNWKLWQLNM